MKFNGLTVLAKPNANTYDIIEALINISPQAASQVKPYLNNLVKLTGDPLQDALIISNFIRKNVTYEADGYSNQNIQLPARLLNDTKIGDCKSFSLLFFSLMSAAGYNVGYRFASYKKNKIPTHVYNYVKHNGKIYTFDTCVKSLKESPRYTYIQDMNVNYLTGVQEFDTISGKAERQAKKAARKEKKEKRREEGKGVFQKVKKVALAAPRTAFRALVALNFRGVATKIDQGLQKNSSKIMELWKKLGGKEDKLIQSVNTGKNKKALLGDGINGYDNVNNEPFIGVAVETLIGSAAAILIPVTKLLKDLGINTELGKELVTPEEEEEAKASGNTLDTPNFIDTTNENKTTPKAFEPSPILIGGVLGAGLLIYLLTKKKK